ncbi:MAG: hypothetical protein ACI4OY_14160 [Aristaeellaceae bacterium]
MAATAKTISLAEFLQAANTYITSAASGDLVKIVDGEQEIFLVSGDLMRLITTCLIHGETAEPQ